MDLEDLLALDHDLALGDGDTYRRLLTEDALVVIPFGTLDRRQCAAAMDESPGWDRVELTEARLLTAAPGVATVVYRFDGVRGDVTYRALMSSTYVRDSHGPRLLLHQQTPLQAG